MRREKYLDLYFSFQIMLPYLHYVLYLSSLQRTTLSHVNFGLKRHYHTSWHEWVHAEVKRLDSIYWLAEVLDLLPTQGSFNVLRGTFGCHWGVLLLKQSSTMIAGWLTICWTELTYIPHAPNIPTDVCMWGNLLTIICMYSLNLFHVLSLQLWATYCQRKSCCHVQNPVWESTTNLQGKGQGYREAINWDCQCNDLAHLVYRYGLQVTWVLL